MNNTTGRRILLSYRLSRIVKRRQELKDRHDLLAIYHSRSLFETLCEVPSLRYTRVLCLWRFFIVTCSGPDGEFQVTTVLGAFKQHEKIQIAKVRK
jgi:hypothetical protein